jgi:hypothetical protein
MIAPQIMFDLSTGKTLLLISSALCFIVMQYVLLKSLWNSLARKYRVYAKFLIIAFPHSVCAILSAADNKLLVFDCLTDPCMK